VLVPNVVDGENVGVIERGGRSRFLLEAVEAFRIGRERGRQNFDGHVAA
jgi:hypothetical protein